MSPSASFNKTTTKADKDKALKVPDQVTALFHLEGRRAKWFPLSFSFLRLSADSQLGFSLLRRTL